MANEALYTNPFSTSFNDAGLNAITSYYADTYGQAKTDLIREDLRPYIFDSAPQQFYDLKILNMQAPKMHNDTEFSWREKGYGRDPVIATASNPGGANQITITVSPSSLTVVTTDTIVQFPNGQKGNIIAINTVLSQITIQCQTGLLAPAVNSGDIINNFSSIEADSATSYAQNFRAITIKRTNFIQMFVKGMNFGDVELEKWKRSGTTDYLDINRREFMRQFRIDISNVYWGGTLGQVNLTNGTPAKMADGVWSMMQKAGSPTLTTTVANVGAALEAAALATEYGEYGQVKFAYMTPTMKNYVAKYYKYPLIRYNVTEGMNGGTEAPLWLDSVNIGSTKIVIVPFKRLEDTASFPITQQNTITLLDQENIIPAYFMAESMIQTPNRRTGLNLNTFTNFVMSADFSIEFNNPLACALITAN